MPTSKKQKRKKVSRRGLLRGKAIELGRGFDSLESDPATQALDETYSTSPPSGLKKQFDLTLVSSSQDIRTALDISASASFGSPFYSVDAQVKFSEKAQFDERHTFFLVTVKVWRDPQRLERSFLLQEALNTLKNSSLEQFFETYGDRFISDITKGGYYYALLEFSSSTTTEQQSLQGRLSASSGKL